MLLPLTYLSPFWTVNNYITHLWDSVLQVKELHFFKDGEGQKEQENKEDEIKTEKQKEGDSNNDAKDAGTENVITEKGQSENENGSEITKSENELKGRILYILQTMFIKYRISTRLVDVWHKLKNLESAF